MNTLHIPEKVELGHFLGLIRDGFQAWVRAGEALVRQVDLHGETKVFRAIQRETTLSDATLRTFLKLGRHELVPEVLITSAPWAKAVSRLSYEEQLRVVQLGVVQVARKCGRKVEFDAFRLEELSERQCKSVFSDFGLRSPAEQIQLTQPRPRSTNLITRGSVPAWEKELDRLAGEDYVEEEKDDSLSEANQNLMVAQNALLKVRSLRRPDDTRDGLIVECLRLIAKLRDE